MGWVMKFMKAKLPSSMKGQAGSALQNMNVMFGLSEDLGLV